MIPAAAAAVETFSADDAIRQSLARGPAGTALLNIERARTGSGSWNTAQAHLRRAVAGPIDAAEHTGLYYGAPALAFLLQAAADGNPRYRSARDTLDTHVLRLTRRRLTLTARRAERGDPTTFAEYDLFYGLTGIGALLLRSHPDSEILADVLRYTVSLTRPRRENGVDLPGWWVAHDPDDTLPTPGGHANLGMAHGAAGLLALLALATARGCLVDGQDEAIATLTGWFDQWRQNGADSPWWPQWITREDLRTGRPTQTSPGRVSWCYGTIGIARAQQLAALATHDQRRAQDAEATLAAALTDTQLDRISDLGLCHGLAGIYQTAYRAARDARSSAIGRRLPAIATRLAQSTASSTSSEQDSGLLTGAAGIALALESTRHVGPPRTGWDTCLLIA
ncbi:class I lanthipeptide synthase [Frankia sp. AiPs1]|uniref:lanthionine synthetase C family protein n=1 Tax=Frankia sp. AiPa1 TaxID=573492 RepID=UPI00202AC2BB|nr:lanthionine synthetase C family protein [Frankia sp. AiPa1]MCL9760161.1 lanthionine synthetase C family protein [Frankia sp. AiPa1]